MSLRRLFPSTGPMAILLPALAFLVTGAGLGYAAFIHVYGLPGAPTMLSIAGTALLLALTSAILMGHGSDRQLARVAIDRDRLRRKLDRLTTEIAARQNRETEPR